MGRNRTDFVWAISGYLKGLGFKGSGTAFSRTGAEAGLGQIVGLWFGTGNCQGLLRLSVGILIAEAYEAHLAKSVPRRPKEYECQVRLPLRTLCGLPGWGWSTEGDVSGSLQAIFECFNTYATPLLDRLGTRTGLLEEDWKAFPSAVFGLDRISRAAILAHLGRTSESMQVLQEEYRTRKTAGAREVLRAAAERIGVVPDL